MELLGVEGKEEKEALAILTKFSADHCQVSFLKQPQEIELSIFQATRFDASSAQRKNIWASLHIITGRSCPQQVVQFLFSFFAFLFVSGEERCSRLLQAALSREGWTQ